MYCPKCGSREEGSFCSMCGERLENPPPVAQTSMTNDPADIPNHALPPRQPEFYHRQSPYPAPPPGQPSPYSNQPQQSASNYGYAQAPPPIVINNINNNTNQNPGFPTQLMVSPKSRWLAFFLCFFLGYLGVHRFYTGKIGTGIFWLFTGGAFGIGWFIDTLSLLFGGFRDGSGLPIKN